MMNFKNKVFLLLLILANSLYAQKENFAKLAPTPPMGWNSYNCFGSAVTEKEIRENAIYMAKNLKKFGWKYIVVDYCWWYPHPPGSIQSNPPQFKSPEGGALVPYFLMDKYGRLQPDVSRFPSSAGGKGMKPLADFVHSLGLKFGIHVMRGIPRQATFYNTPIMGTNNIFAKGITDTTGFCPWLNTMYSVNCEKKGAQEYYDSILKLYASWNVDFIKMDDLQAIGKESYHPLELEAFQKSIQKTGRDIVLSVSPKIDIAHKDHVKKYAQMWRISEDFWDSWEQVDEQFNLLSNFSSLNTVGTYPDGDMLQLGKLSKRGPDGEERFTRLTENEQITHMSLWAIAKSPLIFGGNLPENNDFTLKLITNPEVLRINQNAKNAKQLYSNNGNTVWVSENQNNSKNIGLFNRTSNTNNISVNFNELRLDSSKKYIVRDLWKMKDLGEFTRSFSVEINAHDARLYSIR